MLRVLKGASTHCLEPHFKFGNVDFSSFQGIKRIQKPMNEVVHVELLGNQVFPVSVAAHCLLGLFELGEALVHSREL